MELLEPYPHILIGTATCEVGLWHGVLALFDRTLYSPAHFETEDEAYTHVLAFADQWAAHRADLATSNTREGQ